MRDNGEHFLSRIWNLNSHVLNFFQEVFSYHICQYMMT